MATKDLLKDFAIKTSKEAVAEQLDIATRNLKKLKYFFYTD